LPREINAEGRPVIGREALELISEAEGHWFESSSARHSTLCPVRRIFRPTIK